jgi:hypothetical protein
MRTRLIPPLTMKIAKAGRLPARGLAAQFARRGCCLLQQQRGAQLTTFPRNPRILALLAALTTLGADPAQAQISTTGHVTSGGAVVPPGSQTNPFITSNLVVGDTAFGSLKISSNGTVSSAGGTIGKRPASSGTVTVPLAGSAWDQQRRPFLGNGRAHGEPEPEKNITKL